MIEINSEDIDINKLLSHCKLLLRLFDLKDNEAIDINTIIKSFGEISQNWRFLINEVEKIVRLLLFLQATNSKRDGIFSGLKRVKTY